MSGACGTTGTHRRQGRPPVADCWRRCANAGYSLGTGRSGWGESPFRPEPQRRIIGRVRLASALARAAKRRREKAEPSEGTRCPGLNRDSPVVTGGVGRRAGRCAPRSCPGVAIGGQTAASRPASEAAGTAWAARRSLTPSPCGSTGPGRCARPPHNPRPPLWTPIFRSNDSS